jgi:hypothetical protein
LLVVEGHLASEVLDGILRELVIAPLFAFVQQSTHTAYPQAVRLKSKSKEALGAGQILARAQSWSLLFGYGRLRRLLLGV